MIRIFRDRIFNLAILSSIALHIFWLSIVRVVVTPNKTGPVKFSKVSFLGPIMTKGMLQVGIRPRERSFLERRYLSIAREGFSPLVKVSSDSPYRQVRSVDKKLDALIGDAISASKIEPISEED